MKLTVEDVAVALRQPWKTGHGTVSTRELILVGLHDADGAVGHGEAAPLPGYGSGSPEDVRTGLERCRGVLAGADGTPHVDILAGCAEATTVPEALAAIDLALWDLAARRAGVPVWRLLGAPEPEPVTVNYTLTSDDRSGAAREAAQAWAAGFGTVKAKVAIGDDPGRLAAVRAATGPGMLIRIDANGAWTAAEARASLRALAPIGIELCEEPVAGVPGIRALDAETEIPLALDESAADPAATAERACALMGLKIARCGGLSGLLETARRADAAGYEVLLASTLDGPLGIAAALHAAALLRPARACGLATLSMFVGREDPMPPVRGAITVPAGPGLGDGLLDWYRDR